ncbi:UPF0126 domain-containing protein [Tribonema minus]|uniref:UPF0126 domain-containing protein n=1 Tax=Tribonema minus TaxID=303371 RepID=A0A836CDZ5_9STRA|nr:UPF0126 domain-containing protein [Tribonema minus]
MSEAVKPAKPKKLPPPPPPHEDGLTRYPSLSSPQGVLRGLDLFGTVVFAYSGCVTAGQAGMDLLGCTIVGTITAVGGGTVRDLLLGNTPVFWMTETEYLYICLAAAVGTFFTYSALAEQGFTTDSELLNWADALGVGAFCVIGAQNAVRRRLSTAICVACGMFTATFGGVIRDVLCQRPPRILHSHAEIYASTALVGAGTYMALRRARATPMLRIAGGFGAAFALRIAAWKLQLRLPTWAQSPQPQQPLRTAEAERAIARAVEGAADSDAAGAAAAAVSAAAAAALAKSAADPSKR